MPNNNAPFIGTEALTTIATQIMPEIAMSAYVNKKEIFEKFGIKVISGVAFKNIRYVLLRKGHTTRRKHVGGDGIESQAGTLIERPLITYLAWNRYRSNKNAYREFAVQSEIGVAYPKSEIELRAAVANYADDIYDNVWHGDHNLDGTNDAHLGLFDGFYTDIANDVTAGNIKPIHLSGEIAAPVDTSDKMAYVLFTEFYNNWDIHLQGAPKVIVAMNANTATAIADAYSNAKNNNKEVIYLPNGNYKFPQWPNVEIAYHASLGIGTKMIAYVPNNLEYGIDTENPENGMSIQIGSDKDNDDIFIQPQSAQGTRVANPAASAIAVTDAAMAPVSIAGDYRASTFAVMPNNDDYGTVTVNGETPDNTKKYDRGVTLTLAATAKSNYKFVNWSNGSTDATITVVTKGQTETVVANFETV